MDAPLANSIGLRLDSTDDDIDLEQRLANFLHGQRVPERDRVQLEAHGGTVVVSGQLGSRHDTIAVVHQIVCWTLCIGLSAVAVGLGARLPNLREPSPSKIAAGFGGTLNLVISAVFIIVCVAATAMPSYYLVQAQRGAAEVAWWDWGGFGPVAAGVVITVVAGALVTVIPLYVGFRAFRRLEF